MKRFLPLLLIFLVISFWPGCVEEERGGDTVQIVDMLGRVVEVPKEVDRVVGIEAGALRLIVYLGAADRVVGVEEIERKDGRPYIFAHPELKDRPLIGPIHGGDPELIAAQRPDVIFWTYTTVKKADDLQKKTGIPVVAIDYGDLGERRELFFRALRIMGVLGEEERAEEIIEFFNTTIQDLQRRSENATGPSAYIGGVGYRGPHGILSTEPAYPPFQFLSVDNVAGELGVEHAFIDKEQLLQWDPEVIFVDEGGYSLAIKDLQDEAYSSIEAIREGEIYGVLPYNWYSTNYGTVLSDAYYIGQVLYPERFTDVDPVQKADEIYQFLLGVGVYSDMEEHFGGFKRIELESGE
ncbi:MAG: ABC transporter substrate-binding protein [Thermoplasmata archaeon]|nr:ABC transporter substrate-binding protein [Thermoplasmata archaeon]